MWLSLLSSSLWSTSTTKVKSTKRSREVFSEDQLRPIQLKIIQTNFISKFCWSLLLIFWTVVWIGKCRLGRMKLVCRLASSFSGVKTFVTKKLLRTIYRPGSRQPLVMSIITIHLFMSRFTTRENGKSTTYRFSDKWAISSFETIASSHLISTSGLL